MDKIYFRNQNQVTLFQCEMSGQISDGHWENANPFGHWRKPCNAKISVANVPAQLGCTFTPERYYTFSTSELQFLADRMIFAVQAVLAFPKLKESYSNHWSWEDSFNNEQMTLIESQIYTEKILLADLRDMSKIFRMKSSG